MLTDSGLSFILYIELRKGKPKGEKTMRKMLEVCGMVWYKEDLVALAKRCREEWYNEFDGEDREWYGSLGQYIQDEIHAECYPED